MRRRAFLLAAGTTGLAGCLGSSADVGNPVTTTMPTTMTPLATPTTLSAGTAGQSTTATTPVETAEPAAFSVAGVSAPEAVEVGEPYTLEIEIRNTGGEDGRFVAPLYAGEAGSGTWLEIGTVEVDVPAGGTATWPGEVTYETLGEVMFTLGDVEWSVRIVGATRSFGESYTAPNDMRVTVSGVELAESYEWSSDGETFVETAPAGSRFAFVSLCAENVGDRTTSTPTPADVSVSVGTRQFDAQIALKADGEFDGADIEPGATRRGWMLFEVPTDVTAGDLTVVWRESTAAGEFAALWSADGS